MSYKIKLIYPFSKEFGLKNGWAFCLFSIWYFPLKKPDYLYGFLGFSLCNFGLELCWS